MHIVPRKKRQSGSPITLRDAMSQIFDESFWDPFDIFDRGGLIPGVVQGSVSSSFIPSIDMSETKSAVKIKVDLPGYDPQDIAVQINNGVLTVQGTMQDEKEEKDEDEKWYRKECSCGSFYRQFSLPEYIEEDGSQCTFKNGKLRITIPKKAKTALVKEGKTLKIETG